GTGYQAGRDGPGGKRRGGRGRPRGRGKPLLARPLRGRAAKKRKRSRRKADARSRLHVVVSGDPAHAGIVASPRRSLVVRHEVEAQVPQRQGVGAAESLAQFGVARRLEEPGGRQDRRQQERAGDRRRGRKAADGGSRAAESRADRPNQKVESRPDRAEEDPVRESAGEAEQDRQRREAKRPGSAVLEGPVHGHQEQGIGDG